MVAIGLLLLLLLERCASPYQAIEPDGLLGGWQRALAPINSCTLSSSSRRQERGGSSPPHTQAEAASTAGVKGAGKGGAPRPQRSTSPQPSTSLDATISPTSLAARCSSLCSSLLTRSSSPASLRLLHDDRPGAAARHWVRAAGHRGGPAPELCRGLSAVPAGARVLYALPQVYVARRLASRVSRTAWRLAPNHVRGGDGHSRGRAQTRRARRARR